MIPYQDVIPYHNMIRNMIPFRDTYMIYAWYGTWYIVMIRHDICMILCRSGMMWYADLPTPLAQADHIIGVGLAWHAWAGGHSRLHKHKRTANIRNVFELLHAPWLDTSVALLEPVIRFTSCMIYVYMNECNEVPRPPCELKKNVIQGAHGQNTWSTPNLTSSGL